MKPQAKRSRRTRVRKLKGREKREMYSVAAFAAAVEKLGAVRIAPTTAWSAPWKFTTYGP